MTALHTCWWRVTISVVGDFIKLVEHLFLTLVWLSVDCYSTVCTLWLPLTHFKLWFTIVTWDLFSDISVLSRTKDGQNNMLFNNCWCYRSWVSLSFRVVSLVANLLFLFCTLLRKLVPLATSLPKESCWAWIMVSFEFRSCAWNIMTNMRKKEIILIWTWLPVWCSPAFVVVLDFASRGFLLEGPKYLQRWSRPKGDKIGHTVDAWKLASRPAILLQPLGSVCAWKIEPWKPKTLLQLMILKSFLFLQARAERKYHEKSPNLQSVHIVMQS